MKEDIDKFLEQLETGVNKRKRKLALTAAKKLTNKSPVLTGLYVKNHKVGIDKINTKMTGEYWMDLPGMDKFGVLFYATPKSIVNQLAKKKKAFEKMKTKIMITKLSDTIFISNPVYYADIIEYIGWEKTPARHVYGLTAGELILAAPAIMK